MRLNKDPSILGILFVKISECLTNCRRCRFANCQKSTKSNTTEELQCLVLSGTGELHSVWHWAVPQTCPFPFVITTTQSPPTSVSSPTHLTHTAVWYRGRINQSLLCFRIKLAEILPCVLSRCQKSRPSYFSLPRLHSFVLLRPLPT